MKAIKKYIAIASASMMLVTTHTSCNKFLDIVPDNIATLEYAFRLRNEAEKYLFTLYNYLPKDGNVWNNVAFLGGDEIWIPYQTSISPWAFEIARGNQRVTDPYMNYWYGNYDANRGLYQGIRHCNIFINNMSNRELVPDITEIERERWISEGKFLKAYFHFYLLRMYGAIPIMDVDIDVDSPKEIMDVPRNSTDECFEYIVTLLDECAENLPTEIIDRENELGRITQPIAKAIKAKVLLLAASPLFNGNTDFESVQNKDGKALFNSTYEEAKWVLAAEAAKEAIESAESNGHAFYQFPGGNLDVSAQTLLELNLRQAICEKFNEEHIWADPNSRTWDLQQQAMPPLSADENHNYNRKILSPPLKIAKMFYTKNGVPIDEDRTLSFNSDTELRTATEEDQYYVEPGFITSRLHFDREPRFYSSLAFDGARWYKYDTRTLGNDSNSKVVRSKKGDYAGSTHAFHTNETGYFIKKLVDWNQVTGTSSVTYKDYPWPIVRLSDLYLMYAEALNEAYGPSSQEAFDAIDRVRMRAGLAGVKESWANYGRNPSKFNTKDGFREIIHRERLIELAFEGSRFWDLKRWKKAALTLNEPIRGWNMKGETTETYYVLRTIYNQQFIAPRDYFWPISENTVIQNTNLVQNYGW